MAKSGGFCRFLVRVPLRVAIWVAFRPGKGAISPSMPGPSETLPVLEQRLTERLLAFALLDEAWPKGRTAIERAEIGRPRPILSSSY